ncbi:type I restriction enzyme, S subunit [Rhizobiales bacterium GAS191]|nr:type I restriction enzyme, S subunit [Rhizobiales bacterium GAS191]
MNVRPPTRTNVRLGDLAIFNPATPNLHSDEEVAFVPMAFVSELGTMRVAELMSAGDLKPGYSYMQTGDVLVAKITPCFENKKIAIAELACMHGFGSTEFHVVRADSSALDNRYLLHFLRQDRVRRSGERRMTGSAGQRRVPRQFLEELALPLPPLHEQRRIAAILDQADDLRCKRREALTRVDKLSHSYFVELFGDPLVNPLHWPHSTSLGEVAEIVSGVTKGRKLNGAPTRSVPYLAVANVQARALRLDNVKWIDATENEISRYRLLRDDLLLTEGGDPDKLGRGTLWGGEINECIHQNHVFRVRLTSPDLSPVFLNWLVGSERGKRYFLSAAKQTTGIASINMKQLRDFPLLIPPLKLQRAFAVRVADVDKLKAQHRAHLAKLDALFASLQHRAFRGDL